MDTKLRFLLLMALAAAEPHAGASESIAEKIASFVAVDAKGSEKYSNPPDFSKIDYFALCFGATWCGACENFESRLKAFYRRTKPKYPNFEVIFVSHDFDEARWKEHTKRMPWPVVRFDVEHHRHEHPFFGSFGRRALPGLILISKNGEVLSSTYIDGDWVGPNVVLNDLKDVLEGRPIKKKETFRSKFKRQ